MVFKNTSNSWNKGMNSDLALTVPQGETALFLENFRIVTDSGNTSFSIVNIKGQELSFSFPTTSSVHKLVFNNNNSLGGGLIGSANVSINGTTVSFIDTSFTDFQTTYTNLAAFINATPAFQALGILAYAQSDGVILYSPTFSGNLTVTIVPFIVGHGSWASNVSVPSLSLFHVIGWTLIRDKIVLMTTSSTGINPGGVNPNLPPDPSSDGQIWTLVFDINNVPTLTLKYNNLANFTTFHPIPSPGAIVGRYESPTLQRIYWTDNFNRPRKFNVEDPDGFGISLDQVFLQANTSYSMPVLQTIVQTGSVLSGMHQYAFRMISSSGTETVFSMPCNLAIVTAKNETTIGYLDYEYTPTNVTSGKSLTYTINNLDTSFARVEVVDIYYEDATSNVPVINIIVEEPIPASGSIIFTHTGTEPANPITVEEFTAFTASIERIKTMVSKNNRLFIGNIIETRLDLNYEARAFRYKFDGTSYAPDDDSINPNQSPVPHEEGYIYQDPNTTSGQLIFGGTGINVSYKFTPDKGDIASQTLNATDVQMILDTQPPNWTGPPYRSITKGNYTFNTNVELYPHVNAFRNTGVAYANASVKGYLRDEVYRFGIVFYDLLGNPGYVKWIGDIRMPHMYMPKKGLSVGDLAVIQDTNRELSFPPTRDNGFNVFEGYNLGVEFSVNLPSDIQAQISGFSIVRVHRDKVNSTILGQGLLEPAWKVPGTGAMISGTASFDKNDSFLVDHGFDPTMALLSTTASQHNGCINPSAPQNQLVQLDPDFASFFCPEHLFNYYNISYLGGDSLDVVGILHANQVFNAFRNAGVAVNNSAGVNDGWVVKNYTYEDGNLKIFNNGVANYQGTMPLRSTFEVDSWANSPAVLPLTRGNGSNCNVRNISVPAKNVSAFPFLRPVVCQGAKTLGVSSGLFSFGGNSFSFFNNLFLDNNFPVLSSDSPTFLMSRRAVVVNYKRIVSKQYGGNTFSERSNNTYMPTGHYQRIVRTSPSSFTFRVYGGDTTVNMLDVVPRKKKWTTSDNFAAENASRNVRGRIFTVETSTNLELRKKSSTGNGGRVFNKNTFADTGTNLDINDEYLLDHTYSRESTLFAYFSKPEPFNDLTDFDTRIRGSELKENGEIVDSWSTFRPAIYIDVEGIYGPLNNLINKDDKTFFFQDRAFGWVSINDRAAITDQANNQIQLGVAGLLSRFDYISTEIGCKHQWGMIVGNSHIYFVDALKKKIYRVSNEGTESLGELKGLIGYLNTNMTGTGLEEDNPIMGSGMSCTFDYKFSEAIFTYHQRLQGASQGKWTVVFNELIGAWSSFYGFTPPIYINSGNRIFSCVNQKDVFQHNIGDYCKFYNGAPSKSKLKFVINPEPNETKRFDVFTWDSFVTDESGPNDIQRKDETWDRFRIYDTFQNTDFIPLIPKPTLNYNVSRNRNRQWTTHIPRNVVNSAAVNVDIFNSANLDNTQLYKPRMYDNWAIADFEYDNTNNYKFEVPFIETSYRI